MKKTIYIVTAFLLVLSCKKTTSMNEKEDFKWSAGVTAAKGYPIEVHTGYLATKKDFITGFSNAGVEQDGWAYEGADMGAGGSSIPTLVSLTWVSYAEKKFWELDEAELPRDTIVNYFRKGFYRTNLVTKKLDHQTYKRIVVAVAPGGVVAVFLTGSFHRKEIARFQAKETFVNVNEFYNNPDNDTQEQFFDWYYNHYFTTEQQEDITKNGLPFGLWDAYRTKFNWKITPVFYKDDTTVYQHINYFNGEEEFIYQEELNEKKTYNKPLPKEIDLGFSKYGTTVNFNWEELFSIFKELTKHNPNAQIEIIAKIGFEYNNVTYSIKCEDIIIPLKNTKIQMWSND